jgi:hypothetical protein
MKSQGMGVPRAADYSGEIPARQRRQPYLWALRRNSLEE